MRASIFMAEIKNKFLYHVLLVTIFTSLVLSFLYFQKKEREANYLENATIQQQYQLKALIYSLNSLADALFSNIINKEDILSTMATASKGSAMEQQRQREALYYKLLPLYRNLQEQGGRSILHFHLPGSISFLRFHKPALFGDSLEGVRYSIGLVNETGKAINGFEEGIVIYGFRNVYPLYYGGEFVGSVEISFPFLAIRNLATHIFPAIYSFMIRSDIIDKTILDSARSYYEQCRVSSYHVKLKEVVSRTRETLPTLNIVSFATLKKINSQLREKIDSRLLEGETFSVVIPVPEEKKTLIATFLPVENIKGDTAAYFVSYRADQTLSDSQQRLSKVMFGVLVVAACFMVGGYVYFRQEKTKARYEDMAMTDRLTGLANRQHFDLIFNQITREARRRKEPFSLVLLDVDNFKEMNDTHGHDAGDEVLKSLAELLQRNTREQDFVARWGGEEFTILLPDTSVEQALHLCEKIRCVLQDAVIVTAAARLKVTSSFGIAQFAGGLGKSELLKRADRALYQAKRSGKNRVVVGSI